MTNAETTYLNEVILPKAINALDAWCAHYKLIGTPEETPRYSQLMRQDDHYVLRSTQKPLWYELNLEPTEEKALLIIGMNDSKELWAWWREKRTAHLAQYHKTISVF